jgi:hypothetical protein
MWIVPFIPSPTLPATGASGYTAPAPAPATRMSAAPRSLSPQVEGAHTIFWPGGSVYEALSQVAAALHYRLVVTPEALPALFHAPCPLNPGMVSPMGLAQSAGNALPHWLVALHVGQREIVVSRPGYFAQGVAQPEPATFGMGAEPATPPESAPIPVYRPESNGLTATPPAVTSSAISPAVPSETATDPVRAALRTLLVPVTLQRGDLGSVLRQVGAASGWRMDLQPDEPLGVIGDGLPWGKPASALGILRQLGKQGYLTVRVFPAQKRVVVRVTS